MKIHIFGCSGSGKTYLSNRLSVKYSLPNFDLDNIFWDNSKGSYGIKTPVEERSQMLNDILKQDDWIIEGVYYSWLSESFEKSDKIIILNLPASICKFRIIKRFIKRKLGIERGKNESLKSLIELISWTDRFQEKNFREALEILKPYREKTVILTSVQAIDKYTL